MPSSAPSARTRGPPTPPPSPAWPRRTRARTPRRGRRGGWRPTEKRVGFAVETVGSKESFNLTLSRLKPKLGSISPQHSASLRMSCWTPWNFIWKKFRNLCVETFYASWFYLPKSAPERSNRFQRPAPLPRKQEQKRGRISLWSSFRGKMGVCLIQNFLIQSKKREWFAREASSWQVCDIS